MFKIIFWRYDCHLVEDKLGEFANRVGRFTSESPACAQVNPELNVGFQAAHHVHPTASIAIGRFDPRRILSPAGFADLYQCVLAVQLLEDHLDPGVVATPFRGPFENDALVLDYMAHEDIMLAWNFRKLPFHGRTFDQRATCGLNKIAAQVFRVNNVLEHLRRRLSNFQLHLKFRLHRTCLRLRLDGTICYKNITCQGRLIDGTTIWFSRRWRIYAGGRSSTC